MEDLIKALEDFFAEYGRGRGMEYTYGFMDALAVVREQSKGVRNIAHHPEYNTGRISQKASEAL